MSLFVNNTQIAEKQGGGVQLTLNDIASLIAPDWSRVQYLTLNTRHTMTKHGYIMMRNTEYHSVMSGHVNNYLVFEQRGTYGAFEDWNSIFIPVFIGDTVDLNTDKNGELIFVPCKGN